MVINTDQPEVRMTVLHRQVLADSPPSIPKNHRWDVKKQLVFKLSPIPYTKKITQNIMSFSTKPQRSPEILSIFGPNRTSQGHQSARRAPAPGHRHRRRKHGPSAPGGAGAGKTEPGEDAETWAAEKLFFSSYCCLFFSRCHGKKKFFIFFLDFEAQISGQNNIFFLFYLHPVFYSWILGEVRFCGPKMKSKNINMN